MLTTTVLGAECVLVRDDVWAYAGVDMYNVWVCVEDNNCVLNLFADS